MKNAIANKLQYPYTVWQFLLILLIGIVICSPGVALIKVVEENLFVVGFSFTVFIIVVTLVYAINRKRGVNLHFTFDISDKWLLLLMSLCVIIFQLGVNIPLNFLLSSKYVLFSPYWYYILGVIILAPIMEELVFRGILLKGLLQINPAKKAIVISSVVFCIVHIAPAQLFGAFCLGLFFSCIYYKIKSIGYTIVLHALANIMGIVGKYMFIKWGHPLASNRLYLYLFMLLSVVLTLALLWQLQVQFAKEINEK